jgi:cyclic pyranopterin phosphate synthase
MNKSKKNSKGSFSHIDTKGRAAMVDVSRKEPTDRVAIARGAVRMKKQTLALITNHKISKGNVLETARLAGIMAAKKTSELIPLCHQINLSSIEVDLMADKARNRIAIEARVKCAAQTGVEMEALTAVSAAALTIYDMCKSVDRAMVITDVMLIEKFGGKSGSWKRPGRMKTKSRP